MLIFGCGLAVGWCIARGYSKMKTDLKEAGSDAKSFFDRFSKKD